MIAKNLLKFAEAMALQLPLRFGPLRMLKQARPTSRAGRAARAARAMIRRAALAVKILYPTPKPKAKATTKASARTATQLSLFINKHSLLVTRGKHVWVQSELSI